MDSSSSPFVIVVGGGPSGLLLSLLLGRKNVPVLLLEAGAQLDDRPRATHYTGPAITELRRAGIVEDMFAQGCFVPNGVCWRKLNGDILAGLSAPTADEMICLPLNKLNAVLQKHLAECSSVSVRYEHKVVDTNENGQMAQVIVETPQGIQTLEAAYIVGCDGANSQIRRCLLGEKDFPGFTWEEQIVATNTYYPFEQHGFQKDGNFIIDPQHWYMAARISNDGMWRVSYGELPGLTFEELKERQPMKFREMLPGHPEPADYRIVNFSPYKVHQRLARKMRIGRFLLAADAAHLCNPFGGLGLTGGIVDIGGLFDCLAGIYAGLASDSILDKYDEVRRAKYEELINPISTANIRRLFDQDPDTALQNDEFLALCKKAETDAATSKMMFDGVNALCYDFTQHYDLK